MSKSNIELAIEAAEIALAKLKDYAEGRVDPVAAHGIHVMLASASTFLGEAVLAETEHSSPTASGPGLRVRRRA
jgi:hypothetical protein